MLSSLLQALRTWRQGDAMAQTFRLPNTCWGALRATLHAPCTAEPGKALPSCTLAGIFPLFGWQLFQLSSWRRFLGLCTDLGSRAVCCSYLVWAETGRSRNQHFRAVLGCSDQAFCQGVPREVATHLCRLGMLWGLGMLWRLGMMWDVFPHPQPPWGEQQLLGDPCGC